MRTRFIFGISLILSLHTARAAFAADVPRYNLALGHQLTYSMHIENNANNRATSYDGRWEMTVLKDNADGSKRISAMKIVSTTSTANGQSRSSPEVITRGYFDMKPDGTIKMNPSFVIGYNPNIVFPRLPSTAADIPKGWKGLLERTFVTTTYTMKDPDGDQLVFVGEESGPYHAINKRFDRWSYHFDLAKGLVTKVDAENGQEYGGEQKGSGQIALDKEDQLSEADVKAWADDQEAFVKVYEQAEDMIRKASAGAANADELFQQAHEALTQGSEAAKADSVKADYADALQRQEMAERMAKSYAQRAESAKNQPAVDFTLNDLQGQPHKFADQVGKVVVVDLFRRNGSQCAYTIPQVVEASKKLKDKPVVFFGATDDSDEADIKAVVDATGIKFPVLKLEGPMSDFGAPSAPATVIIDQKGNVSQILQGYSKSRGQDVVELVEALLKNPE